MVGHGEVATEGVKGMGGGGGGQKVRKRGDLEYLEKESSNQS